MKIHDFQPMGYIAQPHLVFTDPKYVGFKTSHECCTFLKKKPFANVPGDNFFITGVRMEESKMRATE
jgi:3'-phosphoadenosine 5'-phosphosulfate sulfotransferase (PAPS reductase)/FAD synthetase